MFCHHIELNQLRFVPLASRQLFGPWRLGVKRRVKEPTDWVLPCQFVPKKNGGGRLVTDLVGLNKFVKHRVHPFTPAKDLLALIPGTAKVFAVFDLKHGY